MTREEAIELIPGAHFSYPATIGADNCHRVRLVGIHTIYGNDAYFFAFAGTRKVTELAANPSVEVVWTDAKRLSQVRMKGKCCLVEDAVAQQRFKDDEPFVKTILLPPGLRTCFGSTG